MRKLLFILVTSLAAVTVAGMAPAWASAGGFPRVMGAGTLGQFGDPTVTASAVQTPSGVHGSFLLTYPDKTTVVGTATCLSVSGKTAYLTGQITGATGPRVLAENWSAGNYIVFGARDNGLHTPDLINFSAGFAANPGCGPNGAATPVFPLASGLFRVFG